MSFLLGMERSGAPFCINANLVVGVEEYRTADGTLSGSQIELDAARINLSRIYTFLKPSEIQVALGIASGSVPAPRASHPDFIVVPLSGAARREVLIGVPSIVRLEPILQDGQVRGTKIHRHTKQVAGTQKSIETTMLPSLLYQKLGIPAANQLMLSDFIFLPVKDRSHYPDCYATGHILKINPRKDCSGRVVGSNFIFDTGSLHSTSLERPEMPLEIYRKLGLAVPREVAQYYHPKQKSSVNISSP